ncbi:hypothetical protein D3C71_1250000 [compost metagenome]
MHHQGFARSEGRSVGQLNGHHVIGASGLRRAILVVVRILGFVLGRRGQYPLTVGRGSPDFVLAVRRLTTPQQLVVPLHFDTRFGDRERHPAIGSLDDQAITFEGRLSGIFQGVVIHPLRRCRCSPGGEYVNAESLRVVLEQLDHPVAEFVLVLGQVGGGDGVERLVLGKRIERPMPLLVTGWHGTVAAGPGRDAAVGIAGTFCSHGGQRAAQGLGLGSTDRAEGRHDRQTKGTASQQLSDFVVMHCPILRTCGRR